MNPSDHPHDKSAKYVELGRLFLKLGIGAEEGARDEEPWTLAHALVDIEDALTSIYDELVPKLLMPDTSNEIARDLLLEICHELRHVLYHLNDSEYLKRTVGEID